VIATSSSDDKLARLQELGASELINYRETENWGEEVRRLTDGRGVDVIIEVGGSGTVGQSVRAAAVGGHISMIGILTGMSGEFPSGELMLKNAILHGITVGSRQHQLDMIEAVESTGIEPVIDSSWPLAGLADAFRHQESQRHFGKICVTV
jgi:NADPH:quinone reductase-like Zn-dependent oxidoreductase